MSLGIADWLARSIPLSLYQRLFPRPCLSFNYHTATDGPVPHYPSATPKTADDFEADLALLNRSFRPISYAQLSAHVHSRSPLPRRAALITVDDGFSECFRVMRPRLLRHKVPCIFFVIWDMLENQDLFVACKLALCRQLLHSLDPTTRARQLTQAGLTESTLASLTFSDLVLVDHLCERLGVDWQGYVRRNKPFMTREEIVTLHREGFCIGAHTLTHRDLRKLPLDEVEHEILESVRRIADLTGANEVPFAFPWSGSGISREFLAGLRRKEPRLGLYFDTMGIQRDVPFVIQRITADAPPRPGEPSNLLRLAGKSYFNHSLGKLREALGPARLLLKTVKARMGDRRNTLKRVESYRANMPRWAELLSAHSGRWAQAREAARNGPRIVVATSTAGDATPAMVESTFGVALTLRNAHVQFLVCDQELPACSFAQAHMYREESDFAKDGPTRRLCPSCARPALQAYGETGLPVLRYSQFITAAERENVERIVRSTELAQIRTFVLDGVAVGDHAHAGALRFFATGEIPDTPSAAPIYRRYFGAALRTMYTIRRMIRQERPDAVLFHHGIYVPLGVIGEVCRQEKVRVVNWVPAYRSSTCILSHEDTYHHTLLSEPVETWDTMQWGESQRSEILAYLKSRWQGSRDQIVFNDRPEEDVSKIQQEVGIDLRKNTIGLLTNVVWDAQLHYPANAFENMIEWVIETIRYFSTRPDLQLLIRVHPAEVTGTIRSRQPIIPEISRVFPVLPDNVYIIPPESKVSTYVAMTRCETVLIYGTKTGVELTSMGIPVVVGGEAWIRNKGLTVDAQSKANYLDVLARLPLPRMPAEQVERALKYAYHFFFRRMIPIDFLSPRPKDWPPYRVALPGGLADLESGAHRGLDLICEGVMTGTPFVYPAETLGGTVSREGDGAALR